MNINPSVADYERALRTAPLNAVQRAAIQTLYAFPGHRASAGQISAVCGWKGLGAANLALGKAARAIAQAIPFDPPRTSRRGVHWWSAIANGDGSGEHFVWVMRDEVVLAFNRAGLAEPTAGVDVLPSEDPVTTPIEEGSRVRVQVNIYERSRRARAACIAYYGFKCAVCDFSFEKRYGPLGQGFIEVHHLIPVSQIGDTYVIDPIKDLRPVCSNCHRMIHRGAIPLNIDELRSLLLAS